MCIYAYIHIHISRESREESNQAGESPLVRGAPRLPVASPPRPTSWRATACWATSAGPGTLLKGFMPGSFGLREASLLNVWDLHKSVLV